MRYVIVFHNVFTRTRISETRESFKEATDYAKRNCREDVWADVWAEGKSSQPIATLMDSLSDYALDLLRKRVVDEAEKRASRR